MAEQWRWPKSTYPIEKPKFSMIMKRKTALLSCFVEKVESSTIFLPNFLCITSSVHTYESEPSNYIKTSRLQYALRPAVQQYLHKMIKSEI
ncbi:hypothetical protein NC652_003644 [Populus alba x Populus x berolinensis]|nr:hypothetical protein NC652_003644 [Populus alba x Populus x berolinensis]